MRGRELDVEIWGMKEIGIWGDGKSKILRGGRERERGRKRNRWREKESKVKDDE